MTIWEDTKNAAKAAGLGLLGAVGFGTFLSDTSQHHNQPPQQQTYTPTPSAQPACYQETASRIRQESNQAMNCGQCHEGRGRVYESTGRSR